MPPPELARPLTAHDLGLTKVCYSLGETATIRSTSRPTVCANRRWHTIPLSSTTADLLKARLQVPGRQLVFGIGVSSHGSSNWSPQKRRLDEKVKIKPWVIHAVRRAVAIGMAVIGVQPHAVEAVLNRVSGACAGVAGRYNKACYEAEKAAAMACWDAHLMAAVSGEPSVLASLGGHR
jgi:hypothetical protein